MCGYRQWLKCLGMRSCTPDYWQIEFLYLQVRKSAQERWAERCRNGIRPNDSICSKYLTTVACCRQIWHRIFSRISIWWALPSWLGAHAENGVPSPPIFHFNHFSLFYPTDIPSLTAWKKDRIIKHYWTKALIIITMTFNKNVIQRFVLVTCINRSSMFYFFAFYTCILHELCLTTSK